MVNVENSILNIEMNNTYYKGLFEKNNTYMNKIRSESFNRGENYLKVGKLIQINIDNFSHYKGDKIIYKFEMREQSTCELECENIESYHIDLEKLRRVCYTNSEEKELIKVLTMFIAKEMSELEGLRSEEYMNDAINELERISRDEEIIGLYDAEEIERKVRNTQLEGARLEGIQEGKEEEKIVLAKKFKDLGVSIDDICKATEISREVIEKL